MNKSSDTNVHLFLTVLVISLIGNACADYALLWHGIAHLKANHGGSRDMTLTSFYVGQALGVILISPLIAVVFDRFTRFVSSVALDLIYAGLLIGMAIFYKLGILSSTAIFIFSLSTAAVAILHKSSVGFAAVQKMSERSGVTDITAKFIAALNIPFLIGAVLSGFIYKYFGFIGCMIIGVITFMPMPLIYWKLFWSEAQATKTKQNFQFFLDLGEGLAVLARDPLLIGTALSIAVLNIASAVLPGLVGIAFTNAYPGRTDYASLAISVAILAGVLVTKKVGSAARDWSTQRVIPLSMLPAAVGLVISLWYPHPLVFAGMFLLSCVGSAARNVSSGSFRVARVPQHLIGRVNTVYTALLYLGQTIGGFVIIQAVQNNLRSATLMILVCFAVASILSVALLPREKVSFFLKVKV